MSLRNGEEPRDESRLKREQKGSRWEPGREETGWSKGL